MTALADGDITAIFVPTTRTREAFARLDDLVLRGHAQDFCRGLVILGLSGCGKTRTVSEWLRQRGDAARREGRAFRCAMAEVPPGCNVRSLASAVLQSLGDPNPSHGSQPEMTIRVHLAAEGMDLVIIDEFQRLIDEKNGKVKKDVANWLTGFLSRRVCPLLLIGEPSAALVFEGNTYLERRFMGQVQVEPYDWHVKDERDEFRAFLNVIDKRLGLDGPSGLASVDTALRIHACSEGRIGLAAKLIDEARALARRLQRPRLTHDLLAQAVDFIRIGGSRGKTNPFRTDSPVPFGADRNVRDGRPGDTP